MKQMALFTWAWLTNHTDWCCHWHYSLSILLGALVLLAMAPLAGTSIESRAMVTYINTRTGLHETVSSNVVTLVVVPQEATALTQDQSLSRAPGTLVTLPHRLTNTGNTPTTYVLRGTNLGNDDYDLTGLTITLDVNSNGVADVNEPVIPNGGTVSLGPRAAANLLLTGGIPGTVSAGQRATVTFTATSQGQGSTASNTDTIVATYGAAMQLTKSASTLTPQRREPVTFTLTGINTGNASAAGIPSVVDGVETPLVMLRDVIPANTTLVSLDNPSDGKVFYHAVGAPTHTYASTPPAHLTQVDAVARGVPSLSPGQKSALRFTVTVNANASGPLTNTGSITYSDGTTASTTVNSNTVQLAVPTVDPTITYYTNDSFTTPARVLSLGKPLFVQADASACNQEPTAIETHLIRITSAATGDAEVFMATESAPNSGIFRILPAPLAADVATHARQSGNGQIETTINDSLIARLEGCGTTFVETRILIDPGGVVFDSKTNATVAGTKVTLIDVTGASNSGNPGGPAAVFLDDGVTPAPSTVLTGPDGRFTFPLVMASTYRLVVVPPADYTFPSTLPAVLLPPNRTIDPAGSYGGTFVVDVTTGTVHLDVPVDRAATGGFLVDKKASRNVVELGDFVDYTVRIKNTRSAAVDGVRLIDQLPAGFALQRHTGRLESRHLPDPEGAPGPRLVFAIGAIPAEGTVTLTYRVRVGPGALQGDGINHAMAESPPPLPQRSNVATAKVEVRGGVFDDKGFVIGKVFVDCNHNRLQDTGEVGIPGIRLYLEDGTFVITDEEGKFSFAGITPHTHVLKLDTTTLPPGASLTPLANRHADDPGSRFVDMKNRDLHKADFAEGSCTPQVLEAVQARRVQAQALLPEIDKGLHTELRPEQDTRVLQDPRTLPASGLLHSKDTVPHFSPVGPLPRLDDQTSALPAAPIQTAPSVDLAQELPRLDPGLGFVDLHDGDTLPMAQTNVRIKGYASTPLTLTVNGTEVPESRVGSKHTLPSTQVQAWEYIGVNLRPGTNTLESSQRDAFGNVHSKAIRVIAPDKLATLKMLVANPRPLADGQTPLEITVRLEDAQGVPVTARTPVTLESSLGRWLEPDLDPREPGLQAFITNGSGTFTLLPPTDPGDAVLRASSGLVQTEMLVPFFPDLRPLLATGLVEGLIDVRQLNPKALVPVRKQDGFERELRELAATTGDGKIHGGGRAALFLKGKIKGDYLLTAAYDSDKDTKERLLRDIQPDEFYPVYGDASIRGFDAQSTSRWYVRVDKNKSYVLYGDYTTDSRNPANNLGRYNRSLTGAKAHYENARVSLDTFASRDNTRHVIEEIPGRGISGPYALRTTPLVENSEQVELLTRDRNQPSVILDTLPMSRFSDYAVNVLEGTLLFTRPVPSVDSNLNPVSIRVTYEVDQGGKDFWVYGAEGQLKVTEVFQVGGSYVRDENPQDRLTIASVNALVKLSDQTYMVAEVAHTDRANLGAGFGWRAEIVHNGTRLKVRLYVSKTEPGFDNPTALQSKDRFEAVAKATYALTENTRLIGEVLHTEDLATGGHRDGERLSVARNFGNGLSAELGMRHATETATPADRPDLSATPFETTSVLAKVGAQVPFFPQLGVSLEYEHDIFDLDRQRAAVGAEYQLLNRSRLYAKHEFLSSLRGPFTLNNEQRQHTTVVGADFDYLKDGHVFSEYRIDDAIAGRDAQAAIGLRHRFRLAEGLTLHAGFERVQTVEGAKRDSTALTGAIEYLALPRLKVTARLELRAGEPSDSLLQTVGVAYKVSRDWTFLGQNVLSLTEESAKERLRLGMAYRDTDTNVWNALVRYEFKYEDNHKQDSERQVHILAASVNYQLIRPVTLSGYAASKWVTDHSNDLRSSSNTHLLSSRATYDITEHWDVGLTGSVLFSGALSSTQYGVGLEIGRLLTTNLWASVGYNVFGFSDADLVGDNYTNAGFFFRFRYKFDEELLHNAAHVVTRAFSGGKAAHAP